MWYPLIRATTFRLEEDNLLSYRTLLIIRLLIIKNVKYRLQNGETRNICDSPTKFLGHTVAATTLATKSAASKSLYDHMTPALNNIESRPIRGEMETWIVPNYLIPSMQFQLAANLIYKGIILKLKNNISKLVKKWLRLPKNAIRVLFHHPATIRRCAPTPTC
jgi:hypothetical protein